MSRMTKTLISTLALLLLAGCASIDFDYPRSESFHLTDTADTYLGKQIAPVVASQPPDQSGFYPMNDGIDALASRLLLAHRAEKSIDVQYYLIKDDIVGRAFILSLREAGAEDAREGAAEIHRGGAGGDENAGTVL